MIRINLLPTKRKKKVLELYTTLIYSAIVSILAIFILGILTFYLSGKVSDLKKAVETREKRLKELKILLKEVADYEKDNESYREKNRIIEQLKKNQQVPLRLLDEVSTHLPKGVWLTAVTDQTGVININGYAFSNSDLVLYVQNLKTSKFFTDVALLESRQAKVGDASLYQFKLTFKVKV